VKKIIYLVVLILVVAGSYFAGSWHSRQAAPKSSPARMVSVGDDEDLPPGAVKVSPEKQQMIGVKVVTVEKVPWSRTLRVLGKVAPDENRVYRLNAALNGWIEEVQPVTTGSIVKKNELLATFYSVDYRTTVQVYLNLVRSTRTTPPENSRTAPPAAARTSPPGAARTVPPGTARSAAPEATKPGVSETKGDAKDLRLSPSQFKPMRDVLKDITRDLNFTNDTAQRYYYRKSLLNFGISEHQIDEMEKGGTIADDIEIRSPIDGFILSRNVSPGLRFDRGLEFFRIADLSKVWILADIFENEASLYQPGRRVKMELPYLNKTFVARISKVLPEFDPATRTLKLRLEVDNPGFILRPEMFVNVEIPISGPPAIIVPVDAVLDTGLKKTVFVARGQGVFEPREVKIGWRSGDRVEILQGLAAGERIAGSGTFLLDSESRMELAAAGISGSLSRDPVSGVEVSVRKAEKAGLKSTYEQKVYYFATAENRARFDREPGRYAEKPIK
jgi:multidrug efflux pump subunit AcrA (membrane-fusion protein)/YHS domain-containing protein